MCVWMGHPSDLILFLDKIFVLKLSKIVFYCFHSANQAIIMRMCVWCILSKLFINRLCIVILISIWNLVNVQHWNWVILFENLKCYFICTDIFYKMKKKYPSCSPNRLHKWNETILSVVLNDYYRSIMCFWIGNKSG